MAGISGSGSSSIGQTSVQYGNNVAPISFPGISSGIDYASIINKLVGITAQQNQPLNDQVTKLNAANAELAKISGLVSSLQTQLANLNSPSLTSSYTASVSDPTAALATSISGSVANPGNYVILSASPATATQLLAGRAGKTSDPTQTLANAGFAITPSNGGRTNGTLTINGVVFNYDVGSTSLNALVTVINAQTGATGVTASYNAASDTFQLSSTGALTIGSGTDAGNLEQVLKLDSAPLVSNGTGGYTLTSSGPLGGVNQYQTLSQGGNAGFASAVTSGSFTINGVSIAVNGTTDSVNNVLTRINNSTAGVLASYDATRAAIVLTNKNTGAQGIVVSDGTSNFASAAHLFTTGSNAASLTVGQVAAVSYLDAAGVTRTAYSSSNQVTNVISGIDLQLQRATTTPYTVNVAQSSNYLVSAVNGFVSAYNAVITEINTATAPPIIGQQTNTATGQSQGTQLAAGGTLFNNQQVLDLKNRLVSYVSNLYGNDPKYNSLSSIGLTLSSSFSVFTATSGSSNSSTGASSTPSNTSNQTQIGQTTYQGTDGTFQPLDITKLQSALAASPSAVGNLFNGSASFVNRLGAYLTNITGAPTLLNAGPVGTVPSTPLITSIEQQNTQNISSLQQRIQLITDQANLQADQLRREFSQSEGAIAGLQALQQQITSQINSGGL